MKRRTRSRPQARKKNPRVQELDRVWHRRRSLRTATARSLNRNTDGLAVRSFGGIQDLHYEQTIGKDVQLVLDGHAIFDTNDYDLTVKSDQSRRSATFASVITSFAVGMMVTAGYLSAQRTTFFPPPFPEMHIDRGEAWIELGLRVPDWPEITFRYSHEFRDGQKDSTTWGDTTLTGGIGTRKVVPSFRDIDEKRDIFSLDIEKTFGNTDVHSRDAIRTRRMTMIR